MKPHLSLLSALGFCLLTLPVLAELSDGKESLKLRRAAEQGDVEAQIDLAEAYHEGLYGLAKDETKSVEWFSKAAKQGDIEGQYNLGIAYYRGIGVKKDMAEAIAWFREAAEHGFADAQYILAAAYQNGLGGLPKDPLQSHLWLSLAEAQGNKEAGRELISLESSMTEEQIAQAKRLFQDHPKPQAKYHTKNMSAE